MSCIDCHVDVNTTEKADHTKDLRLPDAAVWGTCHLQEFAERESERDTRTWPNNEWPKRRPSHALDYRANVETGIRAEKRLGAWIEACSGCHSERFARAYFELIDNATLSGLAKYKEAHEVVEQLYEDGLLPGQHTNRPPTKGPAQLD